MDQQLMKEIMSNIMVKPVIKETVQVPQRSERVEHLLLRINKFLSYEGKFPHKIS
jgi:hypothetical protein